MFGDCRNKGGMRFTCGVKIHCAAKIPPLLKFDGFSQYSVLIISPSEDDEQQDIESGGNAQYLLQRQS